MAKTKTVWYCTNCGNEYPNFGQMSCVQRMEYNERDDGGAKRALPGASQSVDADRKPLNLKEIDFSKENRVSLGMEEVDRLLGGGIVRLPCADRRRAGSGQSTLSLQIPLSCLS